MHIVRRPLVRSAAAVAVVAATALTGASAASADPRDGMHVTIGCGDLSFAATVPGHGVFTPALDSSSTMLLRPVSFDLDGTELALGHGSVARAQAARTITCTVTGPDGYQFLVEGFLTPVGH